MKRHCGDFHSVGSENGRESEMQGKDESFQDWSQPEGTALGGGGCQWLGRWV